MKGADMLLMRVIEALPADIRDGLKQAIEVLPKFAVNAQATFAAIDKRLETIEANQQLILGILRLLVNTDNDQTVYPAGVGDATRNASKMLDGPNG